MTRFFVGLGVLPGLVCSAASGITSPPVPPTPMSQTQLIVRLGADADREALAINYGLDLLRFSDPHRLVLLGLPPEINVNALIQLLELDSELEWVEFNFALGASEGGSQSFFFHVDFSAYQEQYAFPFIGLPAAHQHALGEGVTIALLDTAFDLGHELLQGHMSSEGYNIISMSEDVQVALDGDEPAPGHGTFMAGILATAAPAASILPVQVLEDDGTGDVFSLAMGLLYAVDAGADIVNISVGTAVDTQVMRYAVEEAFNAGVLMTAAAGNAGDSSGLWFPAGYPEVMAVAATDHQDRLCEFSNHGAHIDISAPGLGIVSALPGNQYGIGDGTSMASSLVAGIAAILQSFSGGEGGDLLRDHMCAAAVEIDQLNPEFAGLLGSGRIFAPALFESDLPVGDLNGDGVVDVVDLLGLLGAWGGCPVDAPCPADLTGDNEVGVTDLLLLLLNWT